MPVRGIESGLAVTERERARLRDQVARAKLASKRKPAARRRYTLLQDAAGNAALRALRNAEARRPVRVQPETGRPKRRKTKSQLRVCVYCGTPTLTRGWPIVCHGHSDLPLLDEAYQAELILRGEAA